MKALTLRLDDDVYEALRVEAFEKRTTISDLIRAALRRQGPITDAQVEAAIRRYWWTNPEYVENGNVREAMRAALEAAMGKNG